MTVAVDKISDDDDAIAREDLRAVRSLDFARLSGTLARYVSVCLHSDLLLAVRWLDFLAICLRLLSSIESNDGNNQTGTKRAGRSRIRSTITERPSPICKK